MRGKVGGCGGGAPSLPALPSPSPPQFQPTPSIHLPVTSPSFHGLWQQRKICPPTPQASPVCDTGTSFHLHRPLLPTFLQSQHPFFFFLFKAHLLTYFTVSLESLGYQGLALLKIQPGRKSACAEAATPPPSTRSPFRQPQKSKVPQPLQPLVRWGSGCCPREPALP